MRGRGRWYDLHLTADMDMGPGPVPPQTRPDTADVARRGVVCAGHLAPRGRGTRRHGLCSLLLPALGPDRRPPALAPVAAPSQHHAPLPPNGIRARIWLADVPAAGTPISPPLSPCSCPLWPAGRGTICNGGNTRIGVYGQPINDSSGESPRTLRQRVPALRASPSSSRAFGEDGLRPELLWREQWRRSSQHSYANGGLRFWRRTR